MEPRSMAEVIKELRTRKGMSQTELARLLGYKDRTTVAKLEAGDNGLPDGKVAFVAERLGVTPDYLRNSLEQQLCALDVEIQYEPGQVRLRDADSGYELVYAPDVWEQKKLSNDFKTVWDALKTRDGTVPHAEYREILAEGGLRLLLDADAKLPQAALDEIVNFIHYQQQKYNRE